MSRVRARSERVAVAARVAGLDWVRIAAELDARGWATTGRLLDDDECLVLRQRYDDASAFRSRVIMARHGFGRGEYQYFAAPLPSLVAELRESLYRALVPIANRWQVALGGAGDFPAQHDEYLARCHAAGQTRPTPLILKYEPDDYNCLHQDLYGELVFPLQVAILLSQPGEEFRGGELVLTEQRPRRQSRVDVVPLARGEGVVFAVNQRPVNGTRGVYRVAMRHGVSRVSEGQRFTLGVIFHDGHDGHDAT
jgi:hypothetical protein